MFFVFYATDQSYLSDMFYSGNTLKTEVLEFIDDNFPFVDNYIPKDADIDGLPIYFE